jgi:replicative DNA helicase
MNPRILQELEGIISDAQNTEKELVRQLEMLLAKHKLPSPRTFETYSIQSLMDTILQEECDCLRPYIYDSPWTSFNEKFDGFEAGELVIVGGRPAMGKTNFLHHLALYWTQNSLPKNDGINKLMDKLDMTYTKAVPVLYHTLETTKEKAALELFARAVNKPRNRLFTEDQSLLSLMYDINREMSNRPLYLNDQLFETSVAWEEYLESMIRDYGIKIILIDYIQLLGFSDLKMKRHQEFYYILRTLKHFCHKYKVLIVAASQLSRHVEYRGGDKKPILSDLRDSSALEVEADKVLFLYRSAYYGFECDENGENTSNTLEIIMAKNRSGIDGSVKLNWNKENSQITNQDIRSKKWVLPSDRLKDIEDNMLNDGLPL